MANNEFRGDSQAVAQVTTVTIAGTFAVAKTLSVTINRKVVSYVTVSPDASNADGAAGLYAALTASTIAEFKEAVWSILSNVITATSALAGRPFTLTANATAAMTATVATPTASKGPNHYDDTNNWTTGILPVSGESVSVNRSASIWYGLNAAAVNLNDFVTPINYSGTIGLPRVNPSGYYEYRDTYLQTGIANLSLRGSSSRIKIDLGTNPCTAMIQTSGSPSSSEKSVQLLGAHNDNVATVLQGSVGIAVDPFSSATWPTIRTGSVNSVANDVDLELGAGVSLDTVDVSGGTVAVNSDASTIKVSAGTVVVYGTAEVDTIDGEGGTLYYQSAGDIAAATLGTDFALDFSRDTRPRALGACVMLPGSSFNDPFGTVELVTPISIPSCSLLELKLLDLGSNITIDRQMIA